MLPRTTTLLLGAGSSVAFGYPTASGLRAQILELHGRAIPPEFSPIGDDPRALLEFTEAFRHSHSTSIDEFLSRRPEFEGIGKAAIATVLLGAEDKSKLFDPLDDWFRYLWRILSAEKWEHLTLEKLRVVTFNYDCSLEHLLITALQNSYGKTIEEAEQKARKARIVHVYGSLGDPYPSGPNFLKWGEGARERNRVERATQTIRLMPEGRDSDATVVKASELLSGAESLAIMGFGFDATNLSRLDSRRTCGNFIPKGAGVSRRPVAATCLGMTAAEVRRAGFAIGTLHGTHASTVDPDKFLDTNCLGLFRESSILLD